LRRTSRLILLLGIFLAALTFVVIIVLFNNGGTNPNGPSASQATERPVVVAVVDIPLGTLVTQDMVKSQTMSLTVAKADAFSDPSQVIGQVNKAPITAGGQVTQGQFSGTNLGNLVVPVGMRAFPISVNELTGVANLRPGR
jgi:Flp pilus assembly protein CpaB